MILVSETGASAPLHLFQVDSRTISVVTIHTKDFFERYRFHSIAQVLNHHRNGESLSFHSLTR